MKKPIILLTLLTGLTVLSAQNQVVTGRVSDADTGESMTQVAVVEQHTRNGTLTDENGQFVLSLERPDSRLVIRYLGYAEQVIATQGRSQIDILLQPETLDLDEVVVTALGIEREKRSLGYAVQKVEAAQLTAVREPNLVSALAGKFAGVQVTQGASGIGSSAHIVIRGETSLSGTNQPLFIVDGIPISNEVISNATENLEGGFQEVDYGNLAAELSPDDIASITVLKGAGAAALYGTRAASGVVVITTKEGQVGTRLELHSSVTVEQPLRMPQYQNVYGQGSGGLFFYEDGFGAGANDGGLTSFGPKMDGQLISQFDGPSTDRNGNPVRGGDILARDGNPITPTPFVPQPDNIRNFFETGVTLQNHVALSGGNEQGRFRLSYTQLDNSGMLPNTDLKRKSLSITGAQQLTERFSARVFANFIHSNSNNRPGIGYGSENPMYLFTWMGRQVNTEALRDYWQAGQEGFQQFNNNYLWMDNPYLTMYENTNGFEKNRLLGNVQLTYRLSDYLELRLRSGIDYYHDLRAARRAFSTQRWRNGAYREDEVDFREINTELMISYRRQWGADWDLEASLGANLMDQQSLYKGTLAGQLSVPGIYNFENAKIPAVIQQQNARKRINSLYGLARIGFREQAYLDITLRNDWSSTLPASQNSFGYYSASLSGIVSEWLRLPELIDYAKLRVSIASVGNDTEPFQLRNTFVFNENYAAFPLLTNPTRLLNANLRPERLNALEAGAELWLAKARIKLDVSVYENTSTDQIINLPASSASGYTERVVNGGKIRSRGLEIILALRPVQTQAFQWNVWANFSRNVSEVRELPNGIEQYVTGFARVYSSSANTVFYIAAPGGGQATVGGRMGDLYGTGLKQVNGQDVYDANGFPVRDGTLRYLGNYNPDFMLGLGNQFRFHDFSLDVWFDWRQGGKVVSRMLAIGSTSGVLAHTLEGRETGIVGEGLTNVGNNVNPEYVPNNTSISAAEYYNQFFNRANEANAVYDASYLKLRQIALSWQMPSAWLVQTGLAHAEISLIGSNLWLLTKNPHFDPETTTMQGRNFAFGVEDMAYPSSRSVGLSVKLGF